MHTAVCDGPGQHIQSPTRIRHLLHVPLLDRHCVVQGTVHVPLASTHKTLNFENPKHIQNRGMEEFRPKIENISIGWFISLHSLFGFVQHAWMRLVGSLTCALPWDGLFQDIPDVEGDRVFGIRSFTVQLGQERVSFMSPFSPPHHI